MSKIKFYFNTKSLTYEKVQVRLWDRLKRLLGILISGLVFAAVTIFLAYRFFDSPKERQLRREIEALEENYVILNKKLDLVSKVLTELEERDDNIYRAIFEAQPIPGAVRKAGFGGADRYRDLERLSNNSLLLSTTKKMDHLTKALVVQSRSYDELIRLTNGKELMLASIPAIQPVSNKKLRRMASGFGYRTHPIYKTQHFHSGMDFAAPSGTPIYATGDGIVERADNTAQGYGNHVVINHGYGYKTLYGHMSRFAVRAGKKVKRGEVIGYIGSTGISTAPHVHYEVIRNGVKVNPVNYYYNDLSPAEYQAMIEMSATSNQSFD